MSDSHTLPDICLKSFVAGERDEAERLLEQVEEPQLLKDEKKGGTLLHWAARWGWYETVNKLIEHYTFYSMVKSNNGSVPLLYACFGGCLKTIQFLIEQCKCDPMCRRNDGWTPFHSACAGGNVNIVKYLITQCRCDPMCKDNNGWTPLHSVCRESGNLDVLSYLVNECNCDPMSQSNDGWTPLHSACSGGNINVVEYLITQCRCDPMFKDNNSMTPLHSACNNSGNLKIICYLIEECNCDPTCRNDNGWTPMHFACAKGNIDVVKYLVTECKCDLMYKDNNGSTPLHLVCYNSGNLEVIRYLIEECKCYPMCRMKNWRTPLHLACAGGDINVVKYLVTKYKCDSMCRDNNGVTPLHLVCYNSGNLDVIRYLIEECNCDPMCKNDNGRTPLHFACAKGNIDVVKYLVTKYKCDSMCKDINGMTPLHLVCYNSGNLEVICYLIEECNCDPMCKNDNGRIPLYFACAKGNIDVVKYLVTECKCDLMYKDNNGTTPLHLACYTSDNLEVIRYLIEECKFDPMCRNNNGWTPLYFACAKGNIDIVKYLVTECECDSMSKDYNGMTPLHSVCKYSGNLEVIHFLIEECKCDPMCTMNNSRTPLHSACSGGNVNVVKYLITQCRCDPMCTDSNGMTPLHSVCHSSGNLEVIRYLIEECDCDPMSKSKFLETPLHLACDSGHYVVAEYLLLHCTGNVFPDGRNFLFMSPGFKIKDNSIKSLLKRFSQYSLCLSTDTYINVLLLGDSGVGKTTLTEVIKQRSQGGVWFGQYRKVSGVETLTAGIIPHRLEHKELGNIILHDLAGQPEYYSSHIAVLENVLQGSAAVFIIVVKLLEEAPYRWLSIVKDLSSKCSSTCYVLIVASHADTVKGEERRQGLAQELKGKISSFLMDDGSLQNMGVVYLDCRKLDSTQYSVFKKYISFACESIQNSISLFKKLHSQDKMYCRMLYLLMDSKGQNIYEMTTLLRIVRESANGYYLPESESEVKKCLYYLHFTGLIMFLNTPGGSWIIFKKQVLLSEVNGKIFAPHSFKILQNLASNTGIVSQKHLCNLFPHYDSEMLVKFLLSMKLCERMTPEMMAKTNLSQKDGSNGEGESLFFPGLLSYSKRPVMFNKIYSSDQHEDNGTVINEPFQFGWCLQCDDEHSFFSPHFLHLLILHLAYQYALPESSQNLHNLRCTIWSTGIMWNSGDGIKTLLELVDHSQSVIMLMSVKKGLEHNMLALRRKVIADVLSIREQVCPSVLVKEYIIDPSQLDYPIDKPSSLVLYDIEGIASCIALNKPCVLSYNKCDESADYVEKEINDLFPYEYDSGRDMSVFVGRNIESLRLPGGWKFPNVTSSSMIGILKKYSAAIKELVSASPETYANQLYSAGLIPFPVLDKLQATGLSPLGKASIVIDEVQRNMSGTNVVDKFKKLCEVLKTNGSGTMKEIVMKLESEVGLIQSKKTEAS